MTINPTVARTATGLRGLCGGAVHLPGDAGYDAARTPWNVAVDLRPAAVAYPADAAEAADVVRAAADAGLRVAPQGTGHNAGPLAAGNDLSDVVLLRTSAMQGVHIDPVSRRARVQAGVLWLDVVEAAAEHGLAALHGSSPDVGVVGYSLGGGIGWYGRSLGLQANSLTAVELVTAEGDLLRVDATHEPDLFWALRGGGGNFGVVTALEFALYPIATPYAGMMVWDAKDAHRVLTRWAEWAPDAPDRVTTAFRILQIPPIPEMPEPFRGRTLAVIDGAVLDQPGADAASVVAPLAELGPEMNTFDHVPAAALSRLHMDPEGPTPGITQSRLLDALPPGAVDGLVEAAGAEAGSSLIVTAELRQLGGAFGRSHPDGGALPMLDAQYLALAVGVPTSPEVAAANHADTARTMAAVEPWSSGRQYLNLVEQPGDPSSAYEASAWTRLQQVRAAADPEGRFVANHRVPAAPVLPRQR